MTRLGLRSIKQRACPKHSGKPPGG
jgi:hypothetical protein